ncbi:RNA polymerase sigma factor [Aquisphaera insulae]|uniref:RNA polymerase sigma factor n=1 Tax=Aquisphaera insulae TaxID=2712864 RepID=UPI0013EA4570|nr:sigma-70 family RNA polymerase sigma factor [Aquisphaera insulae]
MREVPDVSELIARARLGDEAAIRAFVAEFEPEVRIMVRGRLPREMRTQFDSMDFVQSVWESFFTDLQERSQDFANVRHLRKFLASVARNKVFEQHRRLTRTEKYALAKEKPLYVRKGGREIERDVLSPDPTPSQNLQARDRLAQLTAGCTPEEVEVIALRRDELTYEEIAERTGLSDRTVRRIIEAARARMEGRR